MTARSAEYKRGAESGDGARAIPFAPARPPRNAGGGFSLRGAWLGLLLLPALLPQFPAAAGAATIVYLSDTVSSINPGGDDERRLNRQRGATAATYVKSTMAGPVTPPTTATQLTKTAGGAAIAWYSDPLDAVTISGNVTFNIWAMESHNQANSGLTAELLRVSASGAVQSVISAVAAPASEIGTSMGAETWTVTPVPTALLNGERLALRVYIDDAGGNMGSGRTVTTSIDGPAPAASGDSWFSTVENLAPARPVIGSVTGLTQTEFSASWTLVEGATGYTLAASVNPGAAPSPVYASLTTSENSALLNSPALSPNTTYYPYVRTDGPGASSSWAAFPAQVTPAYAPSFTDFVNISSYTARFNWAANGNHAATLYRVVMSTAADPLSPFGAPVTSSFTYNTFLSSAGLLANTAYRFRVAAVNHGGVYTAYTPIVSPFTLAGMPAAGPFSDAAESGLTASWTAGGNPAGTLYRLLVSTAADPLSPGGAAVSQHETYNLSLSTSGLSPNTTYYFRGAGVNGDGVAGNYFSAAATATLAAAPAFAAFSDEADASMRFAWTGDGNPAGTLYRVLSSTAPDPLSPAGARVASSDTYNLSLSSSGLTPDTRYYFRTAALNRNGIATAYTPPASRATLLSFEPAFANFSGAAETVLQFNYSANGNAYPGTLFRVLYSTAPDPLAAAGAAVLSSDTYSASLAAAGLASNTTYYFRAAGVNKDGALTAYTAAAGTSTLAAVPSGLEFTETATDKVRLEWTPAGGPGTLYRVLTSTAADPLAPAGAAVTSSDTFNLYLSTEGLNFSTGYFFRARAFNNNGLATAWSAIASTTTLAPGTLAAPLAGALAPHVSSVTASWSLVAAATGYTLAASLYPDDPPTITVNSVTVGAAASAQLPGLAPDTVYYLFVRANGAGVVSAWSKYSPAATLLQYAPAFGSFGSPTAEAVSLSWSGGGNPGGTLYRVLSSTAPAPLSPAGAAVVSSDTYNLSLTSASLAANIAYYFRIAGVNKAGAATAYTASRGTSTLAAQPVFSNFQDTGTGAMTFAWTADGNPAGTLYRVLSSVAPDPLNPGGSPVASSDTYNLALSTAGLAPNTTYYFRAAARNNDGVLTAWTAPRANPTLPQAPAFPGFGTVTDASADFMWAANGNPAGTLYRVLVSRAPDPLAPGAETVTSSDTYNLYLSSGGLAVDRAYYFVVAALARDGQPTAYTPPQRARTLARPPVFSQFSGVTAAAVGANWTANGNPAGTLYRAAVSMAPDPLNPGAEAATLLDSYGLSVSSAGLAADTTYYFRVAAVNGDGVETAYTAAAGTATLAAYPPLFSGFSDIQTDSIRVLWTANGNADGTRYRVAVSTAPDPLAPGGAKVTYEDTYDLSLSSSGLVTSTQYYFRLAAVNKNGVPTAYSAAQSERTLQVVTKLYLLDDVSTANPAGDTGEERRLSAVRGAAAVTYTKDTVNGAVTPPTSALQITRAAGGAPQTWYSMPLAAVTIVSSVTFNVRARESAVQANATITGVLYRTDSSGVILSTVAAALLPRTELTVADAAQTWTVQPAPTALNNGDRLALRLYIDDGDTVTMAGGRSVFVTVGGPTGNAAGDSWVQILEKLYPARPASLTVTGVTANQVSASWPLVSETTGYTLAASENFGSEPQPLYSSSDTLGNLSATLSVPTLVPNTTYYLFVRSNAPGMSGPWQVYPGTATLLAFAPLASGFGSVAADSLLFDWSANGNADPGTLYRVVSSTAADPLNPGGAMAVSSLTYNTFLSTAGLAGDTTYYFRVAGLNHNGVPTAYTAAAATATLLAAPPLFTSFDAIGTGAIRFNWSANGNGYPGTLFRVVSSTAPDPLNPGGAVALSSDTYNLYLASSGLAANTTYYFRVAGVNKNGVSTAYTTAAGTATLAYAPAFGSFTAVSAAALELGWTSGGNPEGTLYRVLSSTAPDPAAPGGAAVTLAETSGLSLSAAGLSADTTYYFRVAALNHNGAATAYTAAAGTATLLGAAPVFTSFSEVTAGALRFSFSPNGNAGGTLYRVVSSTAPDPLNPGGAVAVSSLTYNTSLSTAGLAADTTYYFSVAGVNKNGVATAYTAAAGTATLLGFPPAPAGFSGVAETALQFNFTANGNAYPGTLYRVLYSTAPDPLNPGGAAAVSSDTYNLSLAQAALAADTTYYFRAAGVNKNGILTAWTAAAATSTLANIPSGLYATGITENFMQLNWAAAGNREPGTLYRVLASTAADPLSPSGAAVTSSDTYNLFLSTPGLIPSTAYYFRAAAVNNNGVRTSWSDPPFSAATLSPGSIGSPASGEITGVHVSSLAATWALVPTATGYTLAASLSPDNPPTAVVASSHTLGPDNQAYVWGLAADTVYYLFARANKQYVSGDWYAFPAKATLLEFPPAFVSFTGVAAASAQFNFAANGNAYPGTLFRVLVSTGPDPLAPGASAFSSSDTYNVSLATAGLAADTTYYFSAAGVNKDGALTAYTAVQATATPANIPVFSGFSGVGADALQFNWAHNGNRNPGTRYRVLVSTAADPLNPGAAVVTSSETYNLFLSSAGLAADTTYYFRAAALGVNGLSTAYSAPAGTATLVAYPPVFSGFSGVGTGAIQANWAANGNRYPGTRYRVLVSTAADPLAPAGAVVSSSYTYNLYLSSAGLTPNATRYFAVAAVNQNGELTAWTAPAGTATLANLPLSAVSTFSAVTSGGFTAAWNANANPVGTQYQVQVSTAQDFNAGAAGQTASVAPIGGEAYAFSGLLSNRDYYFRVRALNLNGVYSGYAELGSTRTLGLAAPAPLPVTQVSNYSITGSWSLVAGATGYTLAASENSGIAPSPVYASSVTAGTLAELSGLALNSTYYLFVKAVGPGDESPWALYPATSTLANIPTVPGTPFSAVTDSGFSLTWGANANPLGATRYTVQVSTALDFNAGVTNQVTLATAPAAGPMATFTGLSSDAYYYARVRAEHNNGTSTDWVNLGFAKTLILAALHAAGDGVLVYGQAGNSLPQFRDYNSAANSFSAVRQTVSGAAGALFTVRTNPLTTKQEAVAAYVKSGTLRVLCTDGANWYEEWTQSVGGADTTRRFDIAFETNSGDVMVLYSRGVSGTNELGYRTKSGGAACGAASWSAAQTLDPLRTSGAAHWVKMAPDRRADYDNIAAVWADSNSDLSAMVWNGSAWENEPAAALETSLETVAAAQDSESFAVETESLSGDILVAWGHAAGADGVNGVRYATAAWNGGSPEHAWGGAVNAPAFLDDATNLDLAANPASDEMVFASIGNAGSDLQAGYWNGAAWANSANLDTSAQVPLAGTRLVAAAWVSSGTATRSVITYNDAAATNVGWYVGNGSTFTVQPDFTPAPVFANPQRYYDLEQDPVNRDRLVLALADSNSDLFAKRLVMNAAAAFTWTNTEGGASLEPNLGSALAGGYSFVFWPAPPTTTFEQSAYRFFANTDTTDVGAPLAAQDALASLPAAGAAFRLRSLVNIGQVDLPVAGQSFKLQFAGQGDGTCAAPANGSPAVWTDVTTLTAIAFRNNAPADRATLTANAADPQHGVQATLNQVYAESGGFSNSVSGIARNRDGMWDLALQDNGMLPGAIYCLRLVKGDGVPLEYYPVYPRVVSPAALVLNEVYPSGASAAADWVEIYNNSQSTVPLTNWRLDYVENTIALGGSASTLWTGQAGQYVNAMSTFLVSGLALDLNSAQSYHVRLLDASGGLTDQVQWPGPGALSPGQSFARVSDGHPDYFEIDPTPTPGYFNSVSTGPYTINEVAYGALLSEFVELYSSATFSTVTLQGYALRNAASSAAGLVFRFNRKIYPLDYTALDGSSLSADALAYAAVFGAAGLADAGDFLALENSSGSTVNQVTWQSGSAYSRYNYSGQLTPYANPAPAGAATSIARGTAEGFHSGIDSADFSVSASPTLASRNNNAGLAAANTLAYPDPAASPRYLSRNFPLRLSLGENSSSGTGNNIVLSRAGGAADSGSPHIYRLQDIGFDLSSLAQQTTEQFGLQFYDQDGQAPVSGAYYKFILNSGNGPSSAPQVLIASVAYDASVHSASAAGPAAATLVNDSSRASALRVDLSNNSPAGFNGVEIATVAFKLFREDLVTPLTTAEARALFDAVLLVADSTSTGLSGTYEPAIDVATAAWTPMAAITLDSAGLSTLTVTAAGLDASFVSAGSTRPFYIVFVTTQNASSKTPATFRARLEPATGLRVRDASGLLGQDFTPGAQVDTASFTVIAPALPPPATDWPYVSASSSPITAAITAYSDALLPQARIYMPVTDGTLVSVSTTGALLWSFPTSPLTALSVPPSFPQEEGGSVYLYFAGANGDVYKVRDLGASASQAWRTPLGSAVKSMTDTDTRLYVSAADNKVHCLNKTDGQPCANWSFASEITAPVAGLPTVDERASVATAWAGLEDGKVVSLKTGDGTSNTTFVTGGPVKSSPFFDAYVASEENALYVTSTDGKIYAINSGNMTAMSGWLDYDAGSPIYSSPFLWTLGGTKYVFFGADNGRLYKLNAGTGALVWTFQAGGAIRSSPVLVPAGYMGLGVGEDYVYFGSDDGRIYGVNANTGQLRTGWPVTTGGPVRADPVADPASKTVSVGSADGRLYTIYVGP